ncbi:MAG: hypothetical protein U0X20_22630 [Caldilineaceae bacterium]
MIAKRYLNRRALAVYFVMVYSGAWLSLLGLAGFNLAMEQALWSADSGVMYLARLAGPQRAGRIMAAVIEGRAILGELQVSRLPRRLLLRWHARQAAPVATETVFAV